MKDFVPKAVRDLLSSRWRAGAKPDPDPDWLIVRWFIRGEVEHHGWGPPFSLRQLRALLACGAIPSRFAYIESGRGQLNDYAARSIQTCLHECCEAYRRHLDRMDNHAPGFDLRSWDEEHPRREVAKHAGECCT